MTNRYIVAEESTQSYAVFETNTRECPITSCYVDSIHDFAICKYNVTDLKNFNIKQIELKSELAEIDLKIRVFNNDKSKVLSILLDVISRLNYNPIL